MRIHEERVNLAVAKVPNKEVTGNIAETGGSHFQAPRRIEDSPRGEPRYQNACRSKNIDVAIARSRLIVAVRRAKLLGVCHEKVAVDGSNAKRGVTRRNRGIR